MTKLESLLFQNQLQYRCNESCNKFLMASSISLIRMMRNTSEEQKETLSTADVLIFTLEYCSSIDI